MTHEREVWGAKALDGHETREAKDPQPFAQICRRISHHGSRDARSTYSEVRETTFLLLRSDCHIRMCVSCLASRCHWQRGCTPDSQSTPLGRRERRRGSGGKGSIDTRTQAKGGDGNESSVAILYGGRRQVRHLGERDLLLAQFFLSPEQQLDKRHQLRLTGVIGAQLLA